MITLHLYSILVGFIVIVFLCIMPFAIRAILQKIGMVSIVDTILDVLVKILIIIALLVIMNQIGDAILGY